SGAVFGPMAHIRSRPSPAPRVRGGEAFWRALPPTGAPPPRHDRLRCVADRLDVIAGIEKGDDAAGTSFQALIAPGECADQRTFVEHELDIAAEVLGVQ